MELTFLDKSNYFKGLLLLIGKDKKITTIEQQLMENLGEALGFEKLFVKEAIKNLLQNEYILQDPPKFSQKLFAEAFIIDGIKLALSDNDLASAEYEWLNLVALTNNIDNNWIETQLQNFVNVPHNYRDEKDLAILEFLPEFS